MRHFCFILVGWVNVNLCTKFEVSSFNCFRDKVEGMPNILGVTWPTPRPLSEIVYNAVVGRAKMKLCTNLELTGFIGFWDIVKGMPKILGVAWPRPLPLSEMLHYLWEGPGWSCVPNLKSLALLVLEIYLMICQTFWGSRDLGHAGFQAFELQTCDKGQNEAVYQLRTL